MQPTNYELLDKIADVFSQSENKKIIDGTFIYEEDNSMNFIIYEFCKVIISVEKNKIKVEVLLDNGNKETLFVCSKSKSPEKIHKMVLKTVVKFIPQKYMKAKGYK